MNEKDDTSRFTIRVGKRSLILFTLRMRKICVSRN
jgi:hypothetical protein